MIDKQKNDYVFLKGIVEYIINGKEKGNKIQLLGGDFGLSDGKEYDINSIFVLSLNKFSKNEMIKTHINTSVLRDNSKDSLLFSDRDLKPVDYNRERSLERVKIQSMLGVFEKYNDKFYEVVFGN